MNSTVAAAAGFVAGVAVMKLFSEKSEISEPKKSKNSPPPEILEEQFTRNIQFFGKDGQQKIHSARVIVVGLGGVGSHAAVSLARSGVGHLRLIDFDRVTISSLNRHASGTWSDVGVSKVASVKRFIDEFNPSCAVEAKEELFSLIDAHRLILDFKPDFVIDAIDNVPTKVDLLAFCMEQGIPIISSCGTACKKDPSKFKIGFLEDVQEDELARAVRQRLRKRNVSLKIPVVYSTEKSELKLLPLKDFQEDDPKNFQAVKNFRVRILPVIGPLPTIAGNAMAAFVICQLADSPLTDCTSRDPMTLKQKRKMTDPLREKLGLTAREFDEKISTDALERVFTKCRGRSIFSGAKTGLIYFSWISSELLDERNLFLATRAEAENHFKLGGSVEKNACVYEAAKLAEIEQLRL